MRFVSLLLITLLFSACSKDRPVEFAQGQGKNLNSISSYDGKTFELITGEARSSSSTNSSAEVDSEVGADIPILNSFPIVSYQTKGDKLNILKGRDLYFRGRPGFRYTFKYKIHDDMVMAYLVAKREDMPGSIVTSATELGNGLYEVPYAYKPVSLIRVESVEDVNGEKTNTMAEYGAYNVREATHFKVANVPPTLYEAQSKVDVLPADLFEGEWFFAVTLTKASVEKSTSVGAQFGSDFNFEPASRIRFEGRRDRIRAVNTNVSSKVDATDDINLASVVDFPVKRLNFRTKQIGAGANQMEEKIYADSADAPHWQQLKYVEVDFTEVKSRTTNSEDTALHNFEIAKDYFSFDLEFKQENIRLKFAFKRAHKAKKGIVYPKEDRKIYGFFATQKKFFDDYEYEREEDYEKEIYLSRFYPDNGVIEYYISDLTPREFFPAARRAVRAWDEAFQRAGTGLRVSLNESKQVAVGDIRYNIINIVKNLDDDGGGYGPQLADSSSGEIISSTANIRTGLFTDDTMETIRNHIRAKLGFFSPHYVGFAPSWSKYVNPNITNDVVASTPNANNDILAFSLLDDVLNLGDQESAFGNYVYRENKLVNNTMQNSSKLRDLVSKFNQQRFISVNGGKVLLGSTNGRLSYTEHGELIDTYNQAVSMGKIPNGANAKYVKGNRLFNERPGHENMQPASKRLLRIIKNFCEDDINNYVQDLKTRQITYDRAKELQVIESCHDKAINEVIYGVVLHEMGHNFGLRHNFYGATDVANFPEGTDLNVQFGMSSIMDYMGMPKFDKLGDYDVAAIRYGYARKAESQNEIIDIQDGKSIIASAKEAGKSFEKKYKYCTDEDIDEYIPTQNGWLVLPAQTDPMCERHQFGTTPEEVVDMAMVDYEAFNEVYGRRYDRANGPNDRIAQIIFINTIGTTIKKIYDQWRWHLRQYMLSFDSNSENEVDRIKKKSSGYLENISVEDYQKIIRAMSEDKGKHGEAFKKYYQASIKAYSFFRSILSIPSKFCSVKSSEDQVNLDLLSLYTVRQTIFDDSGVTIQTCDEAEVQGFFADRNLTLVASVGQYSKPMNGDLTLGNPDFQRNDILGYEYSQMASLAMLTARAASMRHMLEAGFRPNFLDNPIYRDDLKSFLMTQTLLGVHSSNLQMKVSVDPETLTDEEVMQYAMQANPQIGQQLMMGGMGAMMAAQEVSGLEAQLADVNAKIDALENPPIANDDDAAPIANDSKTYDVKLSFPEGGPAFDFDIEITEKVVEEVIEEVEEATVESEENGDAPVVKTLDELKEERTQIETALAEAKTKLENLNKQMENMTTTIVAENREGAAAEEAKYGKFYNFYAEKEEHIIGGVSMFVQGLIHPEKPELTIGRIQEFTSFKNPDMIRSIKEQLEPKDYASISYGMGEFVAVKNQNPMMYQVISTANRLEKTKVDAINGVPTELIGSPLLKQVLELILPSQEKLANTTLEEMGPAILGSVQQVQQQIQGLQVPPQVKQEIIGIINQLLSPYIMVIQDVAQNLAEYKAQGMVSVMDWFVVNQVPAEALNGLTKDGVEGILKTIGMDIQARADQADEYNKNFSEFEAQRNILSILILSL